MLGWRTSNSTVLDVSDLEAMADEVRGAAYRIIAGKGATSSAIGLATARILAAISDDEHAVLPVSTRHHIEGVGTVCLSLPMIVGRYGVLGSVDISLDETERAALRHSAAAIRATLDSL
jgi:L-lactate dehydrogenase